MSKENTHQMVVESGKLHLDFYIGQMTHNNQRFICLAPLDNDGLPSTESVLGIDIANLGDFIEKLQTIKNQSAVN